jgi:hypothetical protein
MCDAGGWDWSRGFGWGSEGGDGIEAYFRKSLIKSFSLPSEAKAYFIERILWRDESPATYKEEIFRDF